MLRSDIHYYSHGSIIADSHEQANSLMVIASGLVRPVLHTARFRDGDMQLWCWLLWSAGLSTDRK